MSEEVRQNVLKLMDRKDKLEADIKELTSILTKNGVGMNDPLVDAEGFPIGSIDTYQVRHARHQIICMQNDHKALMKDIEAGLQGYYSTTNAEKGVSFNNTEQQIVPSVLHKIPFAKVTFVAQGSPADIAGLQANDMLTKFGSINAENFKDITDISTVVQHSEGQQISVRLLRTVGSTERFVLALLVPKKWSGKGLLGCIIVQQDQVDR